MSSKKDPGNLMAGMAMGVDFLSKFQKAIVASGGSPLLLRHMSLPANESKLVEVAVYAMSLHFPVPRSELERLAFEYSMEDNDDDETLAKSDCRYWWNCLDLESKYGIPVLTFWGDPIGGTPLIPDEVRAQLDGKPLTYPFVITWEGEKYVVVELALGGEYELPTTGVVPSSIAQMQVAEAKYFDLEN
jgi:hypothetical protein